MTLEKILVGDDQIDFARKNFPFIPNTEVEFIANPDELIRKAKSGEYSIIVTDLNYTEHGEEGYRVLEKLKDVNSRKILWTGDAYNKGVRDRGQSLGAEVLDKDEIGSLVGQVVNKAPLKKEGKILVFSTDDLIVKALEEVMALFFDREQVVVSSHLESELNTGKYGLIIDTSRMECDEKKSYGSVAHDLKYIKLNEVPRVITVHDIRTVVGDIRKIASAYLNK